MVKARSASVRVMACSGMPATLGPIRMIRAVTRTCKPKNGLADLDRKSIRRRSRALMEKVRHA